MPTQSITNPLGAFGQTADLGKVRDEFKTSAAIVGPKAVTVGTDGTVATAATDSTAGLVIGIATNSPASGAIADVVTFGYATAVPVSGTVSAGDVLKRSVTTSGSLAATATPGLGEKIAIAIAASASNVATVWVCK